MIIFFGSAVLLLNNCEEEKAAPRSYPRLSTMTVSNITEHGAIFSAELYSLGTETITDHGFVWGLTDPTITNADRIMLGPSDKQGAFSAEIVSSLRKDIKYTVKPFVQTKEHVVYGTPLSFKSLGSDAPFISDFEPHSAGWMDTIHINGKNFSLSGGENVVYFNKTKCTTLQSTDSTLLVLVSTDLADLKSVLSVDLAGNVAVYVKDTLRLKVPVIQDFYPKQARWGDTITIIGKYLQSNCFNMSVSAIFGRYPTTISEKNSEVIKLVVPLEVTEIENTLKLNIHNQKYSLAQIFTLLAPVISGISPKEGTWGTTVTLKGNFHPTLSKNVVTIGGFPVSVISNTRDSIKVKIPQNLNLAKSIFLDKSSSFSVVSTDTFKLFAPILESVTPLDGISNSSVVIEGQYLQDGLGSTLVKFGSTTATINSHNNTQIDCQVPLNVTNGPLNLSVSVISQSTIYQLPFFIKNPIITNVSPLTGTFYDQITIEGENLLVNSTAPGVYFNNKTNAQYATIVSSSDTKIIVTVPVELDSIPNKIELDYPNKLSIYSKTEFILSPPVITSVSPSVLIPGQYVSVNGTGFNPNPQYNQVFWGKYPLKYYGSNANLIIASIPSNIPNGFNKISIKVGGYKRDYLTLFESRSAWSEIPVPSTLKWSTLNGAGLVFSLKGLGYMMDPEGNMSSYNPITKEFGYLGIHNEFGRTVGFSTVVSNDTLYAIGYDYYYSLGFTRYDPSSNLWVKIGKSPSFQKGGVFYSLNGKLYYGLDIDYGGSNPIVSLKFWIYDASSKTWLPKKDSPRFSIVRAVAYFTIENRGYVLYMDRTFCEYNPDTDTWTKLASYPGGGPSLSGLTCFVLNNKGYVGLGRVPSNSYFYSDSYSDFWNYNPLSGSWTLVGSMPFSDRYYSPGFVVNDKAYIGFGLKNATPIMDFYEFDPAFIAK